MMAAISVILLVFYCRTNDFIIGEAEGEENAGKMENVVFRMLVLLCTRVS